MLTNDVCSSRVFTVWYKSWYVSSLHIISLGVSRWHIWYSRIMWIIESCDSLTQGLRLLRFENQCVYSNFYAIPTMPYLLVAWGLASPWLLHSRIGLDHAIRPVQNLVMWPQPTRVYHPQYFHKWMVNIPYNIPVTKFVWHLVSHILTSMGWWENLQETGTPWLGFL